MKLISYSVEDISPAFVRPDFTLRHVMEVMSRRGLRFVPVVDDTGQMVGAVADGDMRRFIAAQGSLDDPVYLAVNKTPFVIREPMSSSAISSLMMRRGIEALPEVHQGRFVALHILSMVPLPSEMTAVVMAGGLGARLAPLTDKCPKPLLEIGSKPILTHIIEQLREQGVHRFIFSVNYRAEMIVAHYGDGRNNDVHIDYVHEQHRMGTGGALGLINPDILPENFIVCNGDVLNDISIAELLHAHEQGQWKATMVVREHSYTVPYGVINRALNGNYEGGEEKPKMTFWINAGVYMLSRSVLGMIPYGQFYDMPTFFEDMQKNSVPCGTYAHSGYWMDVGSVADFKRANSIYEGR